MKLEKTADGYVVQVPDDVVAALGLHEGDQVKVAKSNVISLEVSDEDRNSAIDRMKALARPLPPITNLTVTKPTRADGRVLRLEYTRLCLRS
ncbi:hypothetical protein MOP88_19740 [Sphingomonas sp. WKB10]|nr:hypothetical protein [Sphingomonas sp. WKB10]